MQQSLPKVQACSNAEMDSRMSVILQTGLELCES